MVHTLLEQRIMGGLYCKGAFCSHNLKVRNIFNMPLDISWLFATIKFRKMAFPFWNSLLNAWRNVQDGLVKAKPEGIEEVLRLLLFSDYSILYPCYFSRMHSHLGLVGWSKFQLQRVRGSVCVGDYCIGHNFLQLSHSHTLGFGVNALHLFLGGLNES